MLYNVIKFILAVFSYILLFIFGWEKINVNNINFHKLSIGVYCHTSFWDGIIGLVMSNVINYLFSYKCYFVMKQSLLGPLPIWLQDLLGVVLIKRGKGGTINEIIKRFNDKKNCCLLISPEGTRSKIHKWHNGPLVLANQLDADVLIFGMDYSKHKINLKRSTNDNIDNIKNILEKECVPLYPEFTSLTVKKNVYTTPINYTKCIICTSLLVYMAYMM